jgi:hypothetical protein
MLKAVSYQPIKVTLDTDVSRYRDRLTSLQQRVFDDLQQLRALIKAQEDYQYSTDLNEANKKLRELNKLYHVSTLFLWHNDPGVRMWTPLRFFKSYDDPDVYLGGFSFKKNASQDVIDAVMARRKDLIEILARLNVNMTILEQQCDAVAISLFNQMK